jgi:outer membrane protein TolC
VAETLSLPALLEEARQQNPELRASREQAAAKAAMPAQARAWDDPTLSYEAWNAPNSFRVDRADNNIFRLSQRIPFPGKRALAADVATHEAAQSMHESEAVELDVVTAVKRAISSFARLRAARRPLAREHWSNGSRTSSRNATRRATQPRRMYLEPRRADASRESRPNGGTCHRECTR